MKHMSNCNLDKCSGCPDKLECEQLGIKEVANQIKELLDYTHTLNDADVSELMSRTVSVRAALVTSSCPAAAMIDNKGVYNFSGLCILIGYMAGKGMLDKKKFPLSKDTKAYKSIKLDEMLSGMKMRGED
jgi:hypothetical protein